MYGHYVFRITTKENLLFLPTNILELESILYSARPTTSGTLSAEEAVLFDRLRKLALGHPLLGLR